MTRPTLQYVAVALREPCPQAVTRQAVASADPGLMDLTVTAASQATMVTLTVVVSKAGKKVPGQHCRARV